MLEISGIGEKISFFISFSFVSLGCLEANAGSADAPARAGAADDEDADLHAAEEAGELGVRPALQHRSQLCS